MSVNRRVVLGTPMALMASGAFGAANVADPNGRAVPLSAKPVIEPNERVDLRSAKPAAATEALAAFASRLSYDAIDSDTIRKAKYRTLDLVGCVIGGVPAAGNAALADLAKVQGGAPEASVVGYGFKVPASQAAMVNATVSRAYDFEVMTVVVDGKQYGSHHSCTTSMTALALSEREHRSGKEFLAALIAGDDICARTLAGNGGMDFRQGWDGAPIYSSIGAAAIAANLMRMSAQQTQDAFGLVVNTIAGSIQNIYDGATDFKLPQGLAARNGILAAELAKRGWVGMGDALRAPYGFYAQYTDGCNNPAVLTERLGEVFSADEYFKPYPSCAGTHHLVEVAESFRASKGFVLEDVRRITIRTRGLSSFTAKPFTAGRFAHCDANFNQQWQLANALVHGPVRQEHYAEEAIRDPRILRLVSVTSLEPPVSYPKGTEVVLLMSDGRVFVERHAGFGAVRHNPAVHGSSYEDLLAKFRRQVAFSRFVPTHTADEIIRRIERLEEEPDMAEFVKLVTRTQYQA